MQSPLWALVGVFPFLSQNIPTCEMAILWMDKMMSKTAGDTREEGATRRDVIC